MKTIGKAFTCAISVVIALCILMSFSGGTKEDEIFIT